MNDFLKKKLQWAKSMQKENKKFFAVLGKRKDLDQLFHREHDEAFATIDCLQCANCCKTTSPIFRDVDIERIAKHLGVKASEFISKNLHLDEDRDYVLNTSPCLFLDEHNYCRIYDVRPKACREYPHTDRKNMSQIMSLTYRNTLVCPAVAMMTEKIRAHVAEIRK